MDASPAPVVIGPDSVFYLVDDHHTLCALDYSGYSSTTVTVEVIADRRNTTSMADFFADLETRKLVYLGVHPSGEPNSLPVLVTWDKLPAFYAFSEKSKSFSDDPWRSMAAFSRKVTAAAAPAPSCTASGDYKYCERCMYRGCEDGTKSAGAAVYYFEFRWGYFMLDATFFNTKWWPSAADRDAFYKAYATLPVFNSTASLAKVDTAKWLDAADLVIGLCRGEATAAYPLPAELYPDYNGVLPGYVAGYAKLNDKDPDCDAPAW